MGVLRHLDDVALVGHIVVAILAEGLSLQLVEAVLGKGYRVCKLAALWHGLVTHREQAVDGGPLLDNVPRVGVLAAEAQADALQVFVLTVEVVHLGNDAAIVLQVFLVEHGVIDSQVDMGRRRHEVYAKRHLVAFDARVFLGLQLHNDVFVVNDARVTLTYDEGLLDGLAALHLDESSVLAVAQHGPVDQEDSAIGIAAFLHLQHVVADVVGLALVRQLQHELRIAASRHVGQLAAALHLQLRVLHLHRSLVELCSLLVELGVAGTLIRVDGLSATCAEDGAPSCRRLVDIDREGRSHIAVAHRPCHGIRFRGERVLVLAVAP